MALLMTTHNIHFPGEISDLLLSMKTFCGYSLDAPREDAVNECPQYVFAEK